jgi:hypothetical protein
MVCKVSGFLVQANECLVFWVLFFQGSELMVCKVIGFLFVQANEYLAFMVCKVS